MGARIAPSKIASPQFIPNNNLPTTASPKMDIGINKAINRVVRFQDFQPIGRTIFKPQLKTEIITTNSVIRSSTSALNIPSRRN